MYKILTTRKMFVMAVKIRSAINKLFNKHLYIYTDPSEIGFVDGLIRWGCSAPITNNPEKCINSAQTIKVFSNKLLFSSECRDRLHTPTYYNYSDPEPNKFPVVIRKVMSGFGGKGIVIVHNINNFRESFVRGNYWTYFVGTQFELRVHYFNNQILRVFKKEPEGDELEFPIRVSERHYHYSLKKTESFPKLRGVIDNFCKIFPESFGGLDIGWDPEKKEYFIFECNSAPGIDENSSLIYAKQIGEYFGW